MSTTHKVDQLFDQNVNVHELNPWQEDFDHCKFHIHVEGILKRIDQSRQNQVASRDDLVLV